jgi:RNA polymerase sigma factor for flagellar operon FliA
MLRPPDDPYAAMRTTAVNRSREDLIEIGLPIVRRMAFRMARRLPSHIEVNDLIGAGTEGLLRAVASFDNERYPQFEPYAKTRIRGAILDELRSNDSLTRYGRERMGQVTKVIRQLQQQLGRAPDEVEVANGLGVPIDQYQKMAAELTQGPALLGLSGVSADDAESQAVTPDAEFAEGDLKRRLTSAISELPERLKQVLALYYQEECTQAEIGEILGVTESRVCQILGEATLRLRAKLETDDEPARKGKPTGKKQR